MTKRVIRKQQTEEPTLDRYGLRPLPTDKAWAGYARQSTTRQLEENPESTRMQTQGVLKRALSLGYCEELGTLYQEGHGIRGVSGRLRIDQRGDLSTVTRRIQADEIKTVFIVGESRLFRDPTGVQYNTFAEICMQHDCRVVTPYQIYDFSRQGDLKAWRQRCESDADLLLYHIPMMHEARRQKALRGEYVSGRFSVGYAVDAAHKLVVYEPHAEVVRWLFKRFKELDGKINALAREVKARGAIFPDADLKLNLKRVAGGWTITRDGLVYLLCNPVYIGHHSVNGAVVKRDHHAAIVDEADFMYAFNRLSDVDLEGNPQERVSVQATRYQRITTQPVPALLTDRITSEKCPVYVNRTKKIYAITVQEMGMYSYEASIKIAVLDALFAKHFTYVVKQDVKSGDGQALHVLNQSIPESSVAVQLANVDKEIKLLRAKMDATDDVPLVKKWNTKLRELNQLRPQLERMLSKQEETLKTAQEYETLLARIRGTWNRMSSDAKQKAVNALIERAILTKPTPHWYQLEVYWKIPQDRVDVAFIWYQRGGGFVWTTEEDAAIRELYPNAEREAVQQALPRRAWYAIRDRACEKHVARTVHSFSEIPEYLCWEDWQFQKEHELTSEANIEHHATWRTKTEVKLGSSPPSSGQYPSL